MRKLPSAALLSAVAVLLLLLLPAHAAAQTPRCERETASARTTYRSVSAKLEKLPEDRRSQAASMLRDAERVLESATEACSSADTTYEHALATGKALVAQGHLAAAQLIIEIGD